MANKRGIHFDMILELLKEGVPPKKIAADLKVHYQTVIHLKDRFFDTVLVLKERHPMRGQGSFFDHYWANR